MSLNVSVVIPVYNVESYIKDCFLSIVGQACDGLIECLFIDDCGTDSSVKVLNDLISAYDGPIEMRVLHHESNRGLSVARNTGIAQSKGDYVLFLDSDDQLLPQAIDAMSTVAVKEEFPDIILGSYRVNDPNHPINQYRYEYQVVDSQPLIANEFLCGKLYCMVPNKLIRRSFIIDNTLWFKEGIIHEDNLWSYQSFHMARKVVTVPDITYLYFIRGGSIMTASKCEMRLESSRIIYDEVLKDIKDGRYEPIGQDSIDYLKDILNTRCIRVFEQFYSKKYTRKERLNGLRSIPQRIRNIIVGYWFPPTMFLSILKFLYKHGYYRLFDDLIMLSKRKNKTND